MKTVCEAFPVLEMDSALRGGGQITFGLQRTRPFFSVSLVAGTSGVAFGNALLLPKAGHAAESECYPP